VIKMTTTIQISDELWVRLNSLKMRGETFEDVLNRFIKVERRHYLKSIKDEVTRK
jgi:predicted CopG family antitoxin